MFFFLFDSILSVEMSRLIVWGKFSPGLNCSRGYYREDWDFCAKVEPDFLALFKKRSEIIGIFLIEIKEKH